MLYGAEVWWRGVESDATPLQKVQNSALIGITGGFKTSPSAALQNEAAIPPITTRIETLQRRYTARLLTLPANHPVRSKGPSTLPNYSGLSLPRGSLWAEWDQAPPLPNAQFHNRIDRTLNGIARWITRSSRVHRTTVTTAPWDTSSVATHIPPYDKATATERHKSRLHATLADPDNIIAYTDGFQGMRMEDKVTATGMGIYSA
jgi:hypothetical protein